MPRRTFRATADCVPASSAPPSASSTSLVSPDRITLKVGIWTYSTLHGTAQGTAIKEKIKAQRDQHAAKKETAAAVTNDTTTTPTPTPATCVAAVITQPLGYVIMADAGNLLDLFGRVTVSSNNIDNDVEDLAEDLVDLGLTLPTRAFHENSEAWSLVCLVLHRKMTASRAPSQAHSILAKQCLSFSKSLTGWRLT